jgi:ABC-type nickel/cobalt efflux system permease component RcnA
MVSINLWDPQNVDLLSALIISYLLGIVHGITPDEHTWPITFSYSVGSYSTRKGMKAGLIFSSGFTIQRALMSEVAFFALAGIFMTALAFGVTYVIVGIAMLAAGLYIASRGKYLHWHYLEHNLGRLVGLHKHNPEKEHMELEHEANPIYIGEDMKPIPLRLAFVHGLIAGFGFGAFALIIYTVIAPSMPNMYWGFVPGLLFGLGTMTMQIAFGAGFGAWLSKSKKLTKKGIAFVAKSISRYVLTYGGLAFIVAGGLIIVFPQLLDYGITTGIHVHNLDNLGIGFFIVIFAVVIIGFAGYYNSMRRAQELGYTGDAKEPAKAGE